MAKSSFQTRVQAVVRSAKAQRDKIQGLIVEALAHYGQHQDASYLTYLVRSCIGVSSLRTNTMKDFIKAHANVSWTKLNDSKLGFKRLGGEDKAVIKEVKTNWYEFNTDGEAVKADFKLYGVVKGVVTRLTKALEAGKVKPEEIDAVNEALTVNQKVLAKLEA